jgi:hypothetical protein
MLTPRNLAIVAAAAGAFAGLPLSTAQACDNDRFPCPIVVDSAQEASEAPSRASPAAQPRKKTGQTARQGDKPTAKVEREASQAPQAPARPRASKPAVQEQADASAKASKPATQEPVDEPVAQKTAGAAPAVPALAPDQSGIANAEVKPAPAAGLAPAAADSPGARPNASDTAATQSTAGGVQMVDPNEVNELDLAAADPAPAPAESSWLSYLLMTLGGALAAASTVRLFLF